MRLSIDAIAASALVLAALGTAGTPKRPHPESANLRVEGHNTIYEGPVLFPYPRNVTTASGGTHPCDGTNEGANPTPGPTCTTLLAQAAGQRRHPFPFDGTYDSDFQDFFITSIGDTTETSTQFWGLLVDFAFTATGGCQTEIAHESRTLWAFDAFNAKSFLQATRGELGGEVLAGEPFEVLVVGHDGGGDAATPVPGASVDSYDPQTGTAIEGGQSVVTDENGVATITEAQPGVYFYKAYQDGSIRSNRVEVHVKAKK